MSNLIGRIFDVQHFSVSDGPGIRTTVFFKGCNLSCVWCHNPESQSFATQTLTFKEKCTRCGRCVGREGDLEFVCYNGARKICGADKGVGEILDEIVADKPFYDASNGGVTFSGGECMLQIDFLTELAKACKSQGVSTAIDTAGHVPYDHFRRILPVTDLVLFDLKCMDGDKHKAVTGVDNSLILDNFRRLTSERVTVWARIPVIPTVNDTVEDMQRIKEFILASGSPERIDLLPYHDIGNYKYEALGRDFRSFQPLDPDKLERLKSVFK